MTQVQPLRRSMPFITRASAARTGPAKKHAKPASHQHRVLAVPYARAALEVRTPVDVEDAKALGQRQACEKGPAATAHMPFSQVDGDAGKEH